MENVNQIKLVITKFNDKKIIISVYSKQNDRYITRSVRYEFILSVK